MLRKNFILLVVIFIVSVSSICNASWWYDFIHSGDSDDYVPNTCYSCGGSGICQTCSGSGSVELEDTYDESKIGPSYEVCSDCSGSGLCSACGGMGTF